MKKICFALLILLFSVISFCHAKERDVVTKRTNMRLLDDLSKMQERNFIRVLVSYSKTNYFVSKGHQQGFEYELMHEYEKLINKGISKKEFRTNVVFIPVPFDELLTALNEGKGDIAAAGLTITPERQKKIAFTEPYLPNVDEVVVTAKHIKGLNTIDDMTGRKVFVVRGSSYIQHLEELNKKFKKKGEAPVKIIPASKTLEAEDILEMVNAGIIELTVVDKHIAEIWQDILPGIIVRDDLKINKGGKIAWAVRKNNLKLLESLNSFAKQNKKGTLIGNILFKRYYKNTKWIRNPITPEERKKLDRYIVYFKKYSEMYDFDWLAIAAQAYQESHLDQSIVNRAGAVGIMQVLPSTAEYVGIKNIENAENNIHAGIKYMHYLRKKFFNDPEISKEDKFDFTLAAYNAGPSRVNKLRKKAEEMGLDKNKWFFNVEHAALEKVGQEPVRYVGNINKYYIAFSLIDDQLQKREQEKNKISK